VVERADREVRVPHEVLEHAKERRLIRIEIVRAGARDLHDSRLEPPRQRERLFLEERPAGGFFLPARTVDVRDVHRTHRMRDRREQSERSIELELLQNVSLVVVVVAAIARELHLVEALEDGAFDVLADEVEPDGRKLAVLESPNAARLDAQRNGDRTR